MNKSNHKIILKLINWIIRVSILMLALYLLYSRIVHKDRISEIIELFLTITKSKSSWLTLSIVLLLMLVNWMIESKKWQLLIYRVQNIDMVTAVKAIFSGSAISIFTPYRVGEMVGRIWYLDRKVRIESALLTALGNFAQILVTLIAGSIGIIFSINQLTPFISISNFWIVFFSVSTSIAGLTIYFFFPVLAHQLGKYMHIVKLNKYLGAYSHMEKSDLSIILILSMIRFCVYSSQFYILLLLCGVSVPLIQGMALIAVLFLCITIIPSIVFTELIIRSSVALILFESFSNNDIGIISASFGLWFINLVLPAIFGSFLLIYSKRKNVVRP